MPQYIKSHSNYVLEKKHQDVNDGTIYERDIATIGGIGSFPRGGQTPIYRSNNFLITVRDDSKPSNQYNTEKWQDNDVSGSVWNLQSISGLTSDIEEENDTKIVLKQDYYDLSDFAYYGSLTELFRASVTDVVSRFPGEMYVTYTLGERDTKEPIKTYYTSSYTVDFETVQETMVLGTTAETRVDNPFGIDIYSRTIPSGANPLKYFANEGWKNYEVIDANGNAYPITAYNLTWYYSELNPNSTSASDKYIRYSASTTSSTVYTATSATYYPCKGDKMASVSIRYDINTRGISVYVGENDEIVYLANLSMSSGIHIRPKKEFLDEFYNECDNFEKLLLNKDTDYTATFSVIRENENGYYRELVPLKFPKGEGGYNIDTSDYGFNVYTKKMVEIGEYYDEKFSDNLWRSMTHEAIKNFDWTYTREYNEGDEEEFVVGGQRLQKALRIFAREFDEILSYINNIRNLNRVTYDERSNVPDYFLTDVVENEGWDVKLIYPYTLTEKKENGEENGDYSEGGKNNSCKGQLDNTTSEGVNITREFSQDSNSAFTPYAISDNSERYGYFNMCSNAASASSGTDDTIRYDAKALGGKGVFKDVVRPYSDDKVWTNQEGNNEFLRRLKINSPYIWRSKGTIDGVEMILGMFGLRSKRWFKAKGINKDYDFDITEYTSFAYRLEELWDAEHQDYRINWLNSTKTIGYDNRTVSYYNKYGIGTLRTPYQGLPVVYRDDYAHKSARKCCIKRESLESQIANGVTPATVGGDCFTREDGSLVFRRYLYPNFNSYEELDGNPYYQMNGGWMSKIIRTNGGSYNFQYDVDNNIVYTEYTNGKTITEDNHPLYKETVRNIRRVDNIEGLLSIPTNNLYNGVMCNVTKIEENTAVIDGVVYPIEKEWDESGQTQYISLEKTNGFIKVGSDKYFDSTLIVYDKDGLESINNIEDKEDGYVVKAYIKSNGTFICKEDYDGNYGINTFTYLDKIWDGDDYTNYFVLDDVYFASDIARWNASASGYTSGWKRLRTNDNEYMRVNTIINYNKGNNPHNGNMVYDNGHEYFRYFSKIFKYALDNELFDTRCFSNYLKTIDEEIPKYGFSGLINSNEDITQYDAFLTKDTKIHFFGNYKKRSSNTSSQINRVLIYDDLGPRVDNYQKLYSAETGNANAIINYKLNTSSTTSGWCESSNPYSAYSGSNVDEVTNQIVNNKRLNIKFYLHDNWYSKKGQEEIKYLDDIVMNYVTQMIPSSTILQVEYLTSGYTEPTGNAIVNPNNPNNPTGGGPTQQGDDIINSGENGATIGDDISHGGYGYENPIGDDVIGDITPTNGSSTSGDDDNPFSNTGNTTPSNPNNPLIDDEQQQAASGISGDIGEHGGFDDIINNPIAP